MSDKQPYPLYELSGEEFKRLCIDLLLAADSSLAVTSTDAPRWIDVVGTRRTQQGDKSVAIKTSHRSIFHPEGLRLFLELLSKEERRFDEYIFITSSSIKDIPREMVNFNAAKVQNAQIGIYGQLDLIELLSRHQAVAAKYFKSVRERVRMRRVSALISSAALVASLGGLGSSLYSLLGPKQQPDTQFSTQIRSVEESLSRLTDLERNLRKLKEELQEKSAESARVSKEYDEAMKLKALTTEQLEQVRKAVNSQNRWDVFQNYFFGFLLGVAGSVLATIITDKWKQRKALEQPYA